MNITFIIYIYYILYTIYTYKMMQFWLIKLHNNYKGIKKHLTSILKYSNEIIQLCYNRIDFLSILTFTS